MKKEIIALVDEVGVDGKHYKKHIWVGALRLIAWKDETLHTEEKMVHWTTTYDGLIDMSARITNYMIVRLIIEEQVSHFNLIDVVQAPVEDEELHRLRKSAKKPVYYEHPLLGKLRYNKRFECFTKKIQWDTDKGTVTIQQADDAVLTQQCADVVALLEREKLQQIKQYAATELAPLTEEWTGKQYESCELLQHLVFKDIVMQVDGEFTVYFSTKALFKEHLIQVEGNRTHGLKGMSI